MAEDLLGKAKGICQSLSGIAILRNTSLYVLYALSKL